MGYLQRFKLKHYVLVAIVAVILAEYFGIFRHLKERDFDTDFSYPLDGDVSRYVGQLKAGQTPSATPVFKHEYYMYKHPKEKCLKDDLEHYEQLRVIYLVKSAAANFERREAIRKTWGFEKRFADVPIRTVFLLGQNPGDIKLQAAIEQEFAQHRDLVQGNFIDSYFNNTWKTALGLRWAVEHCPKSRFYMFVDDDYYVSTRNLLRFLRNPINYPIYLEEDVISFDDAAQRDQNQKMFPNRHLNQLVDFDLPADVRLFAGYVFPHSRPHRHKTSKWFIDLEEYPFNRWPPYVTAGAYVLSRNALVDMYYTSYYTKLFRFDDIWLGLIAKKAELEPFHCDEFHYYRKKYRYSVRGYRYVVASHGFSEPTELQRVWNQQKEAGNA